MTMKSLLFYLNVLIFFAWLTPVKAQVLSNGNITVSVGNERSWSGRNGTGNLSYFGCNIPQDSNALKQLQPAQAQDNCIYLTGGKITCGDGVCRKTWRNQNYSYVLTSPIIDRINTQAPTTLTIYQDSEVVLEETLYLKPFDNLESQN